MKTLFLIAFVLTNSFSQNQRLHSIGKDFIVIEELIRPSKTDFIIDHPLATSKNKYFFEYRVDDYKESGKTPSIQDPDTHEAFYLIHLFVRCRRFKEETIRDIYIYESSKKEQIIFYLIPKHL